ncbi:MAG: 16S rRNA (uracil(1498)-N(3))-methyltransferase [Nitrospinae bacterium]|nr:16S rRNA (uracil(1498)-N(3))-methyltransferase [Nitrospinota bacterium]MBL7019893.1 16S rRNA (uracil(1498)-N(3))-methyltransferase [Nitrospinaceae bacterium]
MSHKFFVPAEQIVSNRVTLTGSDVSHIRTVLRLKAGACIQVIGGSDKLHTVRLVEVEAKEVLGEIIASEEFDVESPLAVHLGLALTKGNKFDATLRKSVELGVRSVTPLITDRCVVKTHRKKTERWKKIALESSKQCGRTQVPLVTEDIETLEIFCRNNDDLDLKLVFWEMESNSSLKNLQLDQAPRSVAVLIGPEGGFSSVEIEKTREHGFQTVSLGPRILRAETAPVVALALLQSLWGDL